MIADELTITRRNLPHWTLDDATYFITSRAHNTVFNKDEQLLVLQHIVKGDPEFYKLYIANVLPDHIHMILKPIPSVSLRRIMKGIKGVSARELNLLRSERGTIWQDESFDHIIRNEKDFNEKFEYILYNPVKHGLTDDPFQYYGLFICDELR